MQRYVGGVFCFRVALLMGVDRSVFHTPTFDYEGLGERYGNRVVGIGEEPFFDPQSKSRTEDLEAQARASNCG